MMRYPSLTPALAVVLAPLLLVAGCHRTPEADNATTPPAAAPSPVAPAATPTPAGPHWDTTVATTPDQGYRMGNPDAPVHVVEFGSRTCPHCAAFAATGMDPLTNDYVATGKVSFEYRDWLRDGGDVSAALIGRCKGTAGFFPLLAAEYRYQPTVFAKESAQTRAQAKAVDQASDAEQAYVLAGQIGYLDFAKANGISDAQAHQCLADTATVEAIGTMNDHARRQYRLTGTPTFLVDGKKVDATDWPDLEADIKTALIAAGK